MLFFSGDNLVVNKYQPDEYNQKWRLTGQTISNIEDGNMVLDIAGFNEEEEATVIAFENRGTDNQLWNFLYQ